MTQVKDASHVYGKGVITLDIEGAIGNLEPLTKPKLELLGSLRFALRALGEYGRFINRFEPQHHK
jgi:hypothetical protein